MEEGESNSFFQIIQSVSKFRIDFLRNQFTDSDVMRSKRIRGGETSHMELMRRDRATKRKRLQQEETRCRRVSQSPGVIITQRSPRAIRLFRSRNSRGIADGIICAPRKITSSPTVNLFPRRETKTFPTPMCLDLNLTTLCRDGERGASGRRTM